MSVAFATNSKPNIVFVLADDLGWADVEFHDGNVPTPNLNHLLANGIELTHHYVAPVCSPTRASLLTGRYWSRYNVTTPTNDRVLPWDTFTLPKALQSVGYQTCLVGKWHLGSLPEWGPNHFGFDHSYGSLGGGVGPFTHRYKKGPYSETWHRNGKMIEETGHATDLLADEAVRWIRAHKDKPFFLYVPFAAVHLPIEEPPEWTEQAKSYAEGELPRHYAACIMHLDAAIGKIIDALEQAGLRENTLIVFTSDNGGSTAENNDTRYPGAPYPAGRLPGNNRPLRGEKGQLYEGGIRAPTIVNWPGILSPGRVDGPTIISDWMPTLCEVAGVTTRSTLQLDGVSLWRTLQNGDPAVRTKPLYFLGVRARSSAIRNGNWKLVVHDRHGKKLIELFDLAADECEANNVSEQNPKVVTDLMQQMSQVAAADGDSRGHQELNESK